MVEIRIKAKANENTFVNFINVTKVAIGRRAVYVEYLEDGFLRFRALSRNEFEFAAVLINGEMVDRINLDNEGFTRFDATYSVDQATEWVEDEQPDENDAE